MEVNINTLSGVQQEADIKVSNNDLQPVFDRAYEKYRKKVEIRGFRKGKAPLEMVKKMYGEAIEHESLDDAADAFFKQAMQERNIRPIGQPTLVDMNFKRGEEFHFKIKYEIRPAISLGKYTGIEAEKPVHTVTDDEINAEVEYLRRANSTSAEVQSVTDENHVITADVQELDEAGTPLIGRKSSGARFMLFDKTLAGEIRTVLMNAEVGGTYRASFESKHDDHSHQVNVSITPTKIEKVAFPEFNDELVKKITNGKMNTAGEFLSGVRRDLAKFWDDQAERKVRDAIADEVVRSHEFDVPESLVNSFTDAFLEDAKNRSRDRKLPANFNMQKFRDESRPTAIWQSKWMLLKEAIIEKESIGVTDAEIDQLAAEEATRTGIEKERILQYYKNSGAANEKLLSEKVVSFLRSQAKIKEVKETLQAESPIHA